MKHPLQMTFADLIEPYRLTLRRSFVILFVVMAIFLFYISKVGPTLNIVGGAIFLLAMMPLYFWASGRVKGFPIAPVVGLGEIMVFAVPILSAPTTLALYTEEEIRSAGMMEILFLLTFTVSWLFFARRDTGTPERFLALPIFNLSRVTLDKLWLLALFCGTAYNVAVVAGWLGTLWANLPAGILGLFRTTFNTMAITAVFFLAISSGMRLLSFMSTVLYVSLLVLSLLSVGTSLLLSSLVAYLFAAVIGFALGRGRIPWLWIVLLAVLLQILHAGKVPLRERHWSQYGGLARSLSPAGYPAFYSDWISEGLRIRAVPADTEEEEAGDLLHRVSIVQMLLYAQARAPKHVEYLNGRTIAIIPPLLVPRVFWPNKPRTHEGQIMLNLHFGRQTAEETEKTYISWGMIAEFYANFGPLGVAACGILFGSLVGWVTAFSAGLPLGSYRCMVTAIFFIFSAMATQTALSVWITVIFQSMIAASVCAFILMRPMNRADLPDDDEDGEKEEEDYDEEEDEQ